MKRIFTILAMAALLLTGCEKETPELEPIAVTSVSLDKTEVALIVGESANVKAIVKPDDAANKEVKWTVANTSIATVDEGEVTAVAVGETTLKVTTVDGGHTATIPVKVTAKTVKVSQIKLVGMPTEFKVGRSVTISAVITPDDATDKSVTFTSSNPEVATVEYIKSEYNYSLALLKAVGPGKATITATANDGSGVKAEAEVTVIDYHITLKTQKSTGTELKLAIRWAETQAVSQDLLIGLEDITMTYESYYDAYIVTGKLTSQTVNVNGDVVYFNCCEQEITSLDVSEATNLSRLICHTNLIETLNVSENLNLTSLDCQRNKLTSLDVSKNTKLDYVQCYINQLTSLTICKRVANGYKDISCYRNRLNEAAMTTLIEALPTTTRSKAELYLQNINQSDEFNSNLTNEQITTAKSKGYTVKIQQSGASGWVEL